MKWKTWLIFFLSVPIFVRAEDFVGGKGNVTVTVNNGVGDNLGSHVSTRPLVMGDFGITKSTGLEIGGVQMTTNMSTVSAVNDTQNSTMTAIGQSTTTLYSLISSTAANLAAPGTINTDGNPVDWSKLFNVPAGFADGSDDGAGGGGTADNFGSHAATRAVSMSGYGIAIASGVRVGTGSIAVVDISTTPDILRPLFRASTGTSLIFEIGSSSVSVGGTLRVLGFINLSGYGISGSTGIEVGGGLQLTNWMSTANTKLSSFQPDNFGSHKATQSIDTAYFAIVNASGVYISTGAGGLISISTTPDILRPLFRASTGTAFIFEINRGSVAVGGPLSVLGILNLANYGIAGSTGLEVGAVQITTHFSTEDARHDQFAVALATAQTFDFSISTTFAYYSQLASTSSNLAAPGVINTAGNPVDWTKLVNVPAGFADGSDDGSGGGGADNMGSHVATRPVIMTNWSVDYATGVRVGTGTFGLVSVTTTPDIVMPLFSISTSPTGVGIFEANRSSVAVRGQLSVQGITNLANWGIANSTGLELGNNLQVTTFMSTVSAQKPDNFGSHVATRPVVISNYSINYATGISIGTGSYGLVSITTTPDITMPIFSISTDAVGVGIFEVNKSSTIIRGQLRVQGITNLAGWGIANSTGLESGSNWQLTTVLSTNQTQISQLFVAVSTGQTYDRILSTGFITGQVVIASSLNVQGIYTSTTGFQVAASTVSGSFMLEGGSVQFRNGTNEFTLVFATVPSAGQHLMVTSVSGNRALITGGGDNAGSGGTGGSDNLGSHVATQPVIMPFAFQASSGVVDSSFTARTIITSTGGFLVGASTMQGSFMLEGGSVQVRNGSNEFTVTFATGGYSVGDRIIVSQVTGSRFVLASGKAVLDTQGAGGGGGSSSLAIATGSAVAMGDVISSPTAIINFSSGMFNASLRGGATAFIAIGTNTPLNNPAELIFSSITGIAMWDTPRPKEFSWAGSALVAVSTLNSPNVPPIVKSTGSKTEILGASYDDTLEECRGGNFIVPEYANIYSTPTFRARWFPSSKSGATGNVIWDFRYSTGVTDSNSWDMIVTTVTAGASAGYAGANRVSSIAWQNPGTSGLKGRGTMSDMGWTPLSLVDFYVCREGGNASDTLVGDAVLMNFFLSVPMR